MFFFYVLAFFYLFMAAYMESASTTEKATRQTQANALCEAAKSASVAEATWRSQGLRDVARLQGTVVKGNVVWV
jgi:hypothetical protein